MSLTRIAAAVALTTAVTGSLLTGTALTGTAAAAVPASTDTTTTVSHFDITYGATYFRGDVSWFNRSVGVDGTLRGLSGTGCRRAYGTTLDNVYWPLDYRSTSTVCDAVTTQHIPLEADAVGGAASVKIDLTDASGKILKYATCTRAGGCINHTPTT
ncbi:hypothetical protein [Labedaea rhizosphaerae]|uniref:Secreted protein n=1 Tax=Labedaea rhizosphaerae TaxID=598644 RepID=A0A4R6SEM2_LABRH|nr:hypothetical protein [Labedaea rhizosphaerae]TDQ00362.1 hypothetical protein EV186_102223 [Labedaea rhizosphaerae]